MKFEQMDLFLLLLSPVLFAKGEFGNMNASVN